MELLVNDGAIEFGRLERSSGGQELNIAESAIGVGLERRKSNLDDFAALQQVSICETHVVVFNLRF